MNYDGDENAKSYVTDKFREVGMERSCGASRAWFCGLTSRTVILVRVGKNRTKSKTRNLRAILAGYARAIEVQYKVTTKPLRGPISTATHMQ